MTPEEFDVVGWSPLGEVPYRQFMATRILDTWAHEQDMRRSLRRPGGRNGAGEREVLDRCAATMPFVVGKQVAPDDGTSVLFAVTGVLGRRVLVSVEGGRATSIPPAPRADPPTVSLTMDQDVFWRRCYGRLGPDEFAPGGTVIIEGDVDLGRRVLAAMAFMI
jgi:hypothetical protein